MSQVKSPSGTDEWNPGKKYQTLVNRINDLLGDEKRTVRDVYYALESQGYDYKYTKVKRALKKGRRSGMIDPSCIVDPSRKPENVPRTGYQSRKSFKDGVLDGIEQHYSINPWTNQPEYVEVWLEKQSLASAFAPICKKWNVRLECTRGDWSDSKVYESVQRLSSVGKDVTVLYFGDYNPSGYHAPVSTQCRMQTYGMPIGRNDVSSGELEYYQAEPPEDSPIQFERVGMNTEHVERFDLPKNPTPSSTDKDKTIRDGFTRHVSGGRDTNIELNALKEFERDYLKDLVDGAIKDHVDMDAWRETKRQTERDRDTIRQALSVDESLL